MEKEKSVEIEFKGDRSNAIIMIGIIIIIILQVTSISLKVRNQKDLLEIEKDIILLEQKANQIKLKSNDEVKKDVLDMHIDSTTSDSIISNWELRFFKK